MSTSTKLNARLARAQIFFTVLALATNFARADSSHTEDCDQEAVAVHVLEQLAVYGPLSGEREYFGFVYRLEGELASAVVRGSPCQGNGWCTVNTQAAADSIPHRAKVLGEWHTHPHVHGSAILSTKDVRGANQNVHIRCYTAYYAASNGKIYSWDPRSTSVPTAMASRTELGSYRDGQDSDSRTRFAAWER